MGVTKELNMKNLISPETLALLKQNPAPLQQIVNFLDEHSDISTVTLCKLIDLSPQKVYDYRSKVHRKPIAKEDLTVVPKNASKKHNRYLAEEKYYLIEKYTSSNDTERAEIIRKYGIYQSDITRWKIQVKEASLIALGKRKERSNKKSDEQKRIEELEQELKSQEKTTAKLSTLLMLQKKTFDILKKND